jgi:ABC-type phosphate transport system substrate-binding protein
MKKITTLLFLLLLASTAHGSGFKIIVNKANRASALSKSEIADLLMKKTLQWSDGTPVLPVDQAVTAKVRADFTARILDKTPQAIKSYWRQQIFSGRGTPPVEHPGDAEVLLFVRNNRGAIGYVSESAPTDGVNVVEVR